MGTATSPRAGRNGRRNLLPLLTLIYHSHSLLNDHHDLGSILALRLAKRPLGIFKKRSRRNSLAVLEHRSTIPTETLSQSQEPEPMLSEPSQSPPTKANLKAWWNHFTFVQKVKKDAEGKGE